MELLSIKHRKFVLNAVHSIQLSIPLVLFFPSRLCDVSCAFPLNSTWRAKVLSDELLLRLCYLKFQDNFKNISSWLDRGLALLLYLLSFLYKGCDSPTSCTSFNWASFKTLHF